MPVAPAIRVRWAPMLDPPFDDEVPPGAAMRLSEQPLPLDWSVVFDDEPLVVAGSYPPARKAAPADPARPVPAGRAAALRFVGAFLEVINGHRPPAHLRPLIGVHESLVLMDELAGALAAVFGPRGRPTRVYRLRRLRTCQPHEDAIEAAAVLGDASHARALAARLDRRPAGWQCTAFRLL